MLQRVAGIDTYTFSAFLMLGIPILTGLAFAAGAFRSRRHWLVVPLSMLAAAAFFLTTPYVGYLDNITVLFLLCAHVPVPGSGADALGTSRRAVPDRHRGRRSRTRRRACSSALTMMGVFGFHLPHRAAAPVPRPEVRRSGAAVRRVRDDRRPRALGGRDLGRRGEPERRGPATPVHEEVLRRAPRRLGARRCSRRSPSRSLVFAVISTIHARPAHPPAGRRLRHARGLVDVPLRRRRDRDHRQRLRRGGRRRHRRAVLPLHERLGRADGARRPGLVRRDHVVLAEGPAEPDRGRPDGGAPSWRGPAGWLRLR